LRIHAKDLFFTAHLPFRLDYQNSTVLQPGMFSESRVVAIIDSNQFTGPALARLGHTPAAVACAEPPNRGLT
jgi:hypothetical protein